MTLKTLFLLFFNVKVAVMLQHEKPVAEKVWSERCEKNTIALNDCNWCQCNVKSAYTCKARACHEVDMFGHFNDAIREMDVGMEGRGVWRSEESACEPGVHYKKNELLCVCTEDSKWPNPVCRDVFQVLHSVEATDRVTPTNNDSCISTKLYLYGCNVCFCPASGKIDPKLCTKRKCSPETSNRTNVKETVEEVYATCTPTKRYKLGCQTCICLRNNRLLCDNCTTTTSADMIMMQNTACHAKKPGALFKKDCNYCQCDKKDTIFCSAKKCMSYHTNMTLPDIPFDLVEQSRDDYNCIPGTKYAKACNTCHCFMLDGVKYFGCTINSCNIIDTGGQDNEYNCVEGTSYQVDCLICHCVVEGETKREYCTIDESCKMEEENGFIKPLSSMHGYCEPMHFYQQDCNKCRCLADGKTVACTSKICTKKEKKTKMPDNIQTRVAPEPETSINAIEDKSMTMEFIPFVQKDNFCPKGQTYMVDCNICYCMKNGNAVCTTKQC